MSGTTFSLTLTKKLFGDTDGLIKFQPSDYFGHEALEQIYGTHPTLYVISDLLNASLNNRQVLA